jgi:ATP-dependent NAD(P)H-hydrate dehydratase
MDVLEPARLLEAYRRSIPDWETLRHKGAAGRVAVVGGCLEYTGAPYLAAMSATRAGADLAYIFCAVEAAFPLKTYAPDLIVIPAYSSRPLASLQPSDSVHSSEPAAVDLFVSWLPRMHAVCFGPGLGRDPGVLATVQELLVRALKHPVPVVIDADALFLLSQFGPRHTGTALATTLEERRNATADRGSSSNRIAPIVVTPNAVETRRLLESFQIRSPQEWVRHVLAPGDVMLEKGETDRIHAVCDEAHEPEPSCVTVDCAECGSPRRCGGQGDILSGILATSLAWMGFQGESASALVAAVGASTLTRRASRAAFGASTNRTERRAFDAVHAHESETMQGRPASCLIYGEQYRFVRDSMGTRVVACAAAREPLRSWKPCQEI